MALANMASIQAAYSSKSRIGCDKPSYQICIVQKIKDGQSSADSDAENCGKVESRIEGYCRTARMHT